MGDAGGAEVGEDRPGMRAYQDVETAIRHEVEVVSQRFPDTDAAVIEAAVRDVYEKLRAEADVEVHLLALTRHRVYDRLQEQGHAFHLPASEPESDSIGDPVRDAGSDTGLRADAEPATPEEPRNPSDGPPD